MATSNHLTTTKNFVEKVKSDFVWKSGNRWSVLLSLLGCCFVNQSPVLKVHTDWTVCVTTTKPIIVGFSLSDRPPAKFRISGCLLLIASCSRLQPKLHVHQKHTQNIHTLTCMKIVVAPPSVGSGKKERKTLHRKKTVHKIVGLVFLS